MDSADSQEDHQHKKLQQFLSDLVRLSLVKGFYYFSLHLRGREEVLISIKNEITEYDNLGSEISSPLASSFTATMLAALKDLQSMNLPYDKKSLMYSHCNQLTLSGIGENDSCLPPASPSERETTKPDDNTTLFLLAGYAKYKCPYVWVRSNHERLVRMTSENDKDKDCPLRLKTSSRWAQEDIKVWDILSELVRLCTYPPPTNPFTVDMEYFECLPLSERFLATGAMVNALHKIVMTTKQPKVYTAKVLEDLQRVTKLHFSCLQQVTFNYNLPIQRRRHSSKQGGSKRVSFQTQRGAAGSFPTYQTGSERHPSQSTSLKY